LQDGQGQIEHLEEFEVSNAAQTTLAEKCTGHAAIDSTGIDREQASRYYDNRANYHVGSFKITALVDVKTLYAFDHHCMMAKEHDAKTGLQV